MADMKFKRQEMKFMIRAEQEEQLQELLAQHMKTNQFSFATIRNIYFDTPDYRLIRTSLEKPIYKEKIRMRSYKTVTEEEKVFVELKKKYQKVVYKRRTELPEQKAMEWIIGTKKYQPQNQIEKEIEYIRQFYQDLQPACFLSYDRKAYEGIEDSSFRLTLDSNILCRSEDMQLTKEPSGQLVLPKNQIIMEVKSIGYIPYWLLQFLSKEQIYKTSFSKYGTAYKHFLHTNKILRKVG